jgi:hypothetical protein
MLCCSAMVSYCSAFLLYLPWNLKKNCTRLPETVTPVTQSVTFAAFYAIAISGSCASRVTSLVTVQQIGLHVLVCLQFCPLSALRYY